MKNRNKMLLLAAVMMGMSMGGADAVDVYTLDPVVVTAQREETEELKTPAAVTVLTSEQLQQTGATGMQEALKFTNGLIIHAQGPRNISQGTMSNKVVIRGVEKGTLVLVDGVPINQSGRYNLEDIPIESVERVEVVRGGGAVLYGSEAMGGVINIITKGERQNSIKAAIGNYGIQNYAGSVQAGKLGVTYSYDHTGKIDNISKPTEPGGSHSSSTPAGVYYNIIRGEHNNLNWRYSFNDNLYFTHTYGRNSDHYQYRYNGRDYAPNTGKTYKDVLHSTEENLASLHYEKEDLKAYIFYNRREQETRNWTAKSSSDKTNAGKFNPDKRTYSNSGYTDESLGLDISNRWHFDENSVMFGFDFQRDMLDSMSSNVIKGRYSRNMYSFYGQLDYHFTEKTSANLNLRETWTQKDEAGNSFNKFTPEFILMHELDENTSLYAKAGKSFMMPTFSQLYGTKGTILPNPGLKPQQGNHFELGWKKDIGNQSWRLALYNYTIKDSIDVSFDKVTGEPSKYINEDVRNTGVELEWAMKKDENLSYHAGISYSHPQKKTQGENNGNWHDYYGKVQLNAGVVYKRGKLTTAANLNFLGDRVRDADPYEDFKPQLFTDLSFSYEPNKEGRFFLTIDNVLDRQDIISTSSSTFYSLGCNFMAGYEYKF